MAEQIIMNGRKRKPLSHSGAASAQILHRLFEAVPLTRPIRKERELFVWAFFWRAVRDSSKDSCLQQCSMRDIGSVRRLTGAGAQVSMEPPVDLHDEGRTPAPTPSVVLLTDVTVTSRRRQFNLLQQDTTTAEMTSAADSHAECFLEKVSSG